MQEIEGRDNKELLDSPPSRAQAYVRHDIDESTPTPHGKLRTAVYDECNILLQ